jgi:hypothetical protein
MSESFILHILAVVGVSAILASLGYVIISQMDYQSRLKSSVDECQRQLKELRELILKNKQA